MKFINNNKIQELIASGVLIEEKAAQKLSLMDNNKLNIVINKINIKKPTILTESLLLSYFPQPVKIIKEFNVIKPKSIQEFVNAINLKYTSLQNVLIQKTDIKNIVSIKNIGNEHCIIIGMIRKVNDAPEKMYVEIEDPTGSIFVNMSKNSFYSKIREDDVVAISGKKVGNIFEAEDIVWPDVPLRTATVGNGKMLFLSGQTLNDKICELIMDADYIFVHNCAGWE
ncbi:MAG: hypothetical protein KQA33_01230, partial [Candidatus Aenigmarchaeota archaeon]|nr:hypothetical protein [Candidatus Aenigmarchaeota archaeon]